MAVLIMADKTHNAICTPTPNNATDSSQHQLSQVKPMFHDFLGADSASVLSSGAEDGSSVSASGGGRGPISSTSDLGSEKQVGWHLEGVPFYGLRSKISVPEISNRLSGSKRSNLDSTFMASSRDINPHIGSDSRENSHLMKLLKKVGGVERPRKSNEEAGFAMQPLRPSSASLLLYPPTGNRIDANFSKWERSTPMNLYSTAQHPMRGGQFAPFSSKVPQSRFKDTNAGPSVISQSAADEGSRTGINGSTLLSSINTSNGERNSSAALPSGSRGKLGGVISEPESSTPLSQHGFTSASRQMTIFYGGQAHVFDDVHPKKADVIMSLAGSNGGSWSTTYSPKASARPIGESYLAGGEHQTGIMSNMALSREARGRLSNAVNSGHVVGSADHISTSTGNNRANIIAKESRNPVQAAERSADDKSEQ